MLFIQKEIMKESAETAKYSWRNRAQEAKQPYNDDAIPPSHNWSVQWRRYIPLIAEWRLCFQQTAKSHRCLEVLLRGR